MTTQDKPANLRIAMLASQLGRFSAACRADKTTMTKMVNDWITWFLLEREQKKGGQA